MRCIGKRKPRSVLVASASSLPMYQTATGDLALQSAALDHMVAAYAAFLMKHYPTTVKRHIHMGINGKIDFIKEHITRDLPESANAIQQFIEDLRGCRKEYKNVMTNFLEYRSVVIPHLIFFQQKPSERGTRITLNSMRALATRMVDLCFEFSDWQSLSAAVHLNVRKIMRGGQYRLKPLPTPPRTSSKDLDQADKAPAFEP
jgi:hypothetical protein